MDHFNLLAQVCLIVILGLGAIGLTPIGLALVVFPKLHDKPDKATSGTVYLFVGVLCLIGLSLF